MKQLYPDLWQTPAQPQSEGLTFYAHLLVRPEGNVLFGNSRSSNDFGQIDELGGLTHHYLTHSHEVHESLTAIAERFGSKLCCHALVEPYLADVIAADAYLTPKKSEFHSGNIELLYTPGHTNNNLCFRYRSPHGKTYLFVGDTIYLDHGEWNFIVFPDAGGDQQQLADTLLELRELEVDVVVPSVSVGKSMEVVEVTRDEWHGIVDKVLHRME